MQLSYITTDNWRIYEEGTLCFNDFQLLYWHCPLLFQSPVKGMRFKEKIITEKNASENGCWNKKYITGRWFLMKVIIIGGVAAGASAAARLRRLDENCKILLLEKAPLSPMPTVDCLIIWGAWSPKKRTCWSWSRRNLPPGSMLKCVPGVKSSASTGQRNA